MLGVLPAAIRQLSNHPGAISQASDQMETIKVFVGKKKKKTQVSGRDTREEDDHTITGRQYLVKKEASSFWTCEIGDSSYRRVQQRLP